MKKTNTILILLVWSLFFSLTTRAQIINDTLGLTWNMTDGFNDGLSPDYSFFELDQKTLEFNAVAPALLLLELYRIELKKYNDSIIGSENSRPIIYHIKEPDFINFYDWTQEYFKEQLKQ